MSTPMKRFWIDGLGDVWRDGSADWSCDIAIVSHATVMFAEWRDSATCANWRQAVVDRITDYHCAEPEFSPLHPEAVY